ncbi:MAG: glycosyltransferase [Acetobacteraceae bacterium]
MVLLLPGVGWLALMVWLLVRVLRQLRAHRAAPVTVQTRATPLPPVSVVIPVRNEAENIRPCLTRLLQQNGTAVEYAVLAVDDDSQDNTAAVVQTSFATEPRVALLTAGPLPEGWMGKPHACWRGAVSSGGEWLCFIDADVRAAPDLIAAAVQTAQAHGIDMLSLHPFQELGSFWERLIVPPAALMIACATNLRQVDDPESSEVTANGQFILIRRDVYFAVGGHAAVRDAICEDKALAGRVKRGGWRFRVLGAEHLARTRMYTGLASLWEGFSKNAIEIMGDAAGTIAAALGGVIVAWGVPAAPIAIGIAALVRPTEAGWLGFALALAGSAIVLGVQGGTARHFRVPIVYVLLFPIGVTLAAMIGFYSVLLHATGRVTWKGRACGRGRPATADRPSPVEVP